MIVIFLLGIQVAHAFTMHHQMIQLPLRIVRSPQATLDSSSDAELDAEVAERASRAQDGAALAAASWGAWRNRAPTDAKARAHHILVSSEELAMSLLQKLTVGAEDISQLAAEHSSCPSKDNGGDLGSFVPGDMVEEFDACVFDEATPIGEPVRPVKTPFGFHVIIVDSRTGTL